MNSASVSYWHGQLLVNRETASIVSICVSLIYAIFTKHIKAFKSHVSAKTHKTDGLISKWSVYFSCRCFLLIWQERLLEIILQTETDLAVRTLTGSGTNVFTALSLCMANTAYYTCFQWTLRAWHAVLVFFASNSSPEICSRYLVTICV